MNERIRELKEQAFNFVAKQSMVKKEYFWENIRHDRTLQDKIDEKFAELIVEECASMARVYCSDEFDFTGDLELDEFMLKHFGVEE